MNKILSALADLFALPDPRFNLCVKAIGFLARDLDRPEARPSNFVPIRDTRLAWTRDLN